MRPRRRRSGVIKALKVLKIWSKSHDHDYVEEFNHKNNWTKRMVNTRCPCSCSGCCNIRNNKWESENNKKTLQERRSIISFKEQLSDILTENNK